MSLRSHSFFKKILFPYLAVSDLSFGLSSCGIWASLLWDMWDPISSSLARDWTLHCKVDSEPLDHQGRPILFTYLYVFDGFILCREQARSSLSALSFSPSSVLPFFFLVFLLKDVQSDWWGREGTDGKLITFPLGFLGNSWLLTKRVMIMRWHVWFYPRAQNGECGKQKGSEKQGEWGRF